MELKYYQQTRHELGYDIASQTNYPAIDKVEDIMTMIHLEAIVIPYGDIHKERDIGLLFTCTWDYENGVGVCILDEKVAEVGYQNAVI